MAHSEGVGERARARLTESSTMEDSSGAWPVLAALARRNMRLKRERDMARRLVLTPARRTE